jgi:hypothetical protein
VLFSATGENSSGDWSTPPLIVSDGSWQCLAYPPTPPGMTPGEVIRHAVSEAQARGAIGEVRLGFDDRYDSGGNPWPVEGNIATKVGTNLWVFIGEEMAATYVDVSMAPGDFTLQAWGKGKRGRNRGPVLAAAPPTNPDAGNLRGLTHHLVR